MVEGVCGGLRRKSVRMSLRLLGWGSEMFPKEEPLRLRSALRRREPRMQTPAMVSRIPAARPGKNPTRTAVAGNLLHSWGMITGVFVEGEEEDVELGWVEELGDAEPEDEDDPPGTAF